MTLIPDEIRNRHRRRADLTVSQWAQRYRMVTDGPLLNGSRSVPWDNAIFPPAKTIMDAAGSGLWRRVIMLASPQTSGKTALAINALLYSLHWKNVDVMYMHANAAKAEAQWAKKVGPAILAHPELAKLVPFNRDDAGTKEARRFTTGAMALITGSESEADLSGPTIPVIFADDVHAMPARLGQHGHPVEFAEKRAAAYPPDQRITICAGQASSTDNWMHVSLQRSAYYCLYLPCPQCGTYQLLEWSRMRFDSTDASVAGGECWMQCGGCDYHIRHEDLPGMLERYAWVSQPPGLNVAIDSGDRGILKSLKSEAVYPETRRATRDAGFWWPAFYWPLVPWSTYAVEYVASEGLPDARRTFLQQTCVQPQPPDGEDMPDMSPDDVTRLANDSHRWRIVPTASRADGSDSVVIVSVDVQAGYVWYLVAVWRVSDGTGWLLECGRFGRRTVATARGTNAEKKLNWRAGISEALDGIRDKESAGWQVISPTAEYVDGQRAGRIVVDCGFEREVVQLACRRYNGGMWAGTWIAAEGSQARAKTSTPVWPGMNKSTVEKKTKRRYWECNVNRAKLYIRQLLAIPSGEPGSLTLPADMPDKPRDWFCGHMCAEDWDEQRGVWKQRRKDNHLLDCMAMQIAGALSCGVRFCWMTSEAPGESNVAPAGSWAAGRKRRQ